MAVNNLEISTENLLGIVLQMPKEEFDHFLKDAWRLKKREAELIEKIKTLDFTPEKEKLYRSLLKKFRAKNITSEEQQILTELSEELEGFGVQRLKCLIEISQIRHRSLEEVMTQTKELWVNTSLLHRKKKFTKGQRVYVNNGHINFLNHRGLIRFS